MTPDGNPVVSSCRWGLWRSRVQKACAFGCLVGLFSFTWVLPVVHFVGGYGFRVTYYQGTTFGRAVARRTELTARKDCGSWSIPVEKTQDGFSTRWKGWIHVPATGVYTFVSQGVDGVRLSIDGKMVIDRWAGTRSWRRSFHKSDIQLDKGPHAVIIEHYGTAPVGGAGMEVKWSGPDGGGIPRDTLLGAPQVRYRKPFGMK